MTFHARLLIASDFCLNFGIEPFYAAVVHRPYQSVDLVGAFVSGYALRGQGLEFGS
ncbi:MAG: hypothetical protein HC934_11015 [Acaryochloridaceae cyanobacterium SU_2_1]|nr:hypothetical protein [Acaryochloridaceae cyanobacterium SU_2_1]